MKQNFEELTDHLLTWYEENKRDLPWRREPSAYHVWVSEIMLQQTRVEAVKGYYDRFLCALPTVADLAYADTEQLLKLWEGLGYYNRVRNMQAAAKTIMEEYGGEFPDTYEELLKLKGIGSYTAGAIASIAFSERVPAVDGNVLRVVSRLTGSYLDIAKQSTKKVIEEYLKELMPFAAPAAFNQALMELGALVCLPNGAPKCERCPWREICVANQEQLTSEIPVKAKKAKQRVEQYTVLLLLKEGEQEYQVIIEKRPEKGLLAGLWQFPMLPGKQTKKRVEQEFQKQGIKKPVSLTKGPQAKHVFSHIIWQMDSYVVMLEDTADPLEINGEPLTYVTLTDLKEQYSIPSAFAVYKKWLLEGGLQKERLL